MPKLNRTSWRDDPNAESVMKSIGISFESLTIGLSEIDWNSTDQNPGRLGREYDKETVEDYAHDMSKGDKFPKPVAKLNEKGKYVVLAGVHRARASELANHKEIEIYCVEEMTSREEFLLCIQTNRKEGRRTPKKVAYRQGIYLVQEYEVSIKYAADCVGVSPSTLSKWLKQEETKKHLNTLGFKGDLGQEQLGQLGTLPKFDELLLMSADLMNRYNLTSEETKNLVEELKSLRSEAQQLMFLEDEKNKYKKDREKARGKRGNRSAKSLFKQSINNLNSRIERFPTKEKMEISIKSNEFYELKKLWETVKRKVNNVFAECSQSSCV